MLHVRYGSANPSSPASGRGDIGAAWLLLFCGRLGRPHLPSPDGLGPFLSREERERSYESLSQIKLCVDRAYAPSNELTPSGGMPVRFG